MIRTVMLSTLAAAGLAGCASPSLPPGTDATDWELLKLSMVGTFSSREQSKADPRNFQDVRLVTTNIWPGRDDGYWLYVEQALTADTARPYRQRIYRVRPEAGSTFRTTVFTIPGDPTRFSDGSGHPVGLETLCADDLSERDGCDIILRPGAGRSFVGGTVGRDCPSDLKGAAYATSTVQVSPECIVSWDRGFDAAGRQVWGAATRGYIFRRQNVGHALADGS